MSHVYAFAQLLKQEEGEPYGWIITKDHLYRPSSSDKDEAGTMGPSWISEELKAQLLAGEGREFRMYDDDNELYYTGKILTPESPEGGGDEDFGPLDDFGRPNAGATEIRYYDERKGRWLAL